MSLAEEKKASVSPNFGCTDDWEQLTTSDLRQIKAQVEFELKGEEGAMEIESFMNTADGIGSSGSASASTEGAATVKLEEKTPGRIVADKVESLKANAEQTLAKIRDISLDTRMMIEKAAEDQKAKKITSFFVHRGR